MSQRKIGGGSAYVVVAQRPIGFVLLFFVFARICFSVVGIGSPLLFIEREGGGICYGLVGKVGGMRNPPRSGVPPGRCRL